MIDVEQLSLTATLLIFGISSLVIALVGSQLARLADRLADVTGLGEAVFGAVLLGASTSFPGVIASITTAAAGRADLAVGNAISAEPLFIISLTILLTAILLLGLIQRERKGVANIGFESVWVLVFYLLGLAVLVFW